MQFRTGLLSGGNQFAASLIIVIAWGKLMKRMVGPVIITAVASVAIQIDCLVLNKFINQPRKNVYSSIAVVLQLQEDLQFNALHYALLFPEVFEQQ